MHSLFNTELTPLTRDLAISFHNMEAVPGERELKSSRLKFFRDHLKAKTLRDLRWTRVVNETGGNMRRLDGQHTSHVLATCAPELFPSGLKVSITTYMSDDLANDAPSLFDVFDHPKAARNSEDAIGFYRSQWLELHPIGNHTAMHAVNGIAEFESSQEEGVVFVPRKRGLYFAHPHLRAFTVWMHALGKDANVVNGWLFTKSGIVAEMLVDWKADPALATEFWGYVLGENHPDRNHVTRDLAEHLKRMNQRSRTPSQLDFRKRANRSWSQFRKFLSLDVTAPAVPIDVVAPPAVGEQPSILTA